MKHIVFDCDGTLLDTSGYKYKLFPGIKELLIDLAREHMLYVWTARGRDSTLRVLEELGVGNLFEAYYTMDDGPAKPNVAGISSLVAGHNKDSVCMIGDTSNDIIGGKNFGVLTLGAIWNGQSSGPVLTDFGADFIVSHPSECSTLIQQNLKAE